MIVRGWQARLYPTPEQARRLNQWAGSLRFLWNRLREREKTEYQATGRFIWRKELQPIAVGMKRQDGLEWLADLPAHAVLDTVARMDGALRRMVNERKAEGRAEVRLPKDPEEVRQRSRDLLRRTGERDQIRRRHTAEAWARPALWRRRS